MKYSKLIAIFALINSSEAIKQRDDDKDAYDAVLAPEKQSTTESR